MFCYILILVWILILSFKPVMRTMKSMISMFNIIRYMRLHGYVALVIFLLPFIKLLAHSLLRKLQRKESLRKKNSFNSLI